MPVKRKCPAHAILSAFIEVYEKKSKKKYNPNYNDHVRSDVLSRYYTLKQAKEAIDVYFSAGGKLLFADFAANIDKWVGVKEKQKEREKELKSLLSATKKKMKQYE